MLCPASMGGSPRSFRPYPNTSKVGVLELLRFGDGASRFAFLWELTSLNRFTSPARLVDYSACLDGLNLEVTPMEPWLTSNHNAASNQATKFKDLPPAKVFYVLSALVLFFMPGRIYCAIVSGGLTGAQCLRLLWTCGWCISFVAGIIFVNLTGEATSEAADQSPVAEPARDFLTSFLLKLRHE